MIKTKALFLISVVFSLNILISQNLHENLGGVRTNFQIFSDGTSMEVSDQILILRAEGKYDTDITFGYGWGYGYRSVHFECIVEKPFQTKIFKHRAGRDNSSKLELIFFDSDNTVLTSISIPFTNVKEFMKPSGNDGPFFYSIDLVDVPVVLLNRASKIDMIKKISSRNR